MASEIKEEYTSLRTELVYWQNFRFVLLGASITLMAGIVGFAAKQATANEGLTERIFDLSSFLFFLSGVMGLSCYAGRGNFKIGTYLSIFHTPQENISADGKEDTFDWAGRARKFSEEVGWFDRLTLNKILSVIYFILGAVAWLILLPPTTKNLEHYNKVIDTFLSFSLYKIIDKFSSFHMILLIASTLLFSALLLFHWFCSSPKREKYRKIWKDIKDKEIRTPTLQQDKVIDMKISEVEELIRKNVKYRYFRT